MADRFYSEGSKNNGSAGGAFGNENKSAPVNPYTARANRTLGDFSENIDSNIVRPGHGAAQTQRKFEVHINDFDDFLGMPELPSSPEAPKPIGQTRTTQPPHTSAPVRRVPVQRNNMSQSANTAPEAKRVTVNGTRSSQVRKVSSFAPTAKNSADATRRSAANKEDVLKNKQAAQPAKATSKRKSSNKKILTPEQRARLKANKRYNFTKVLLASCVCIFFIAILTVTATTIALETLNDILVIDKGDNISTNITVEQGDEFIDVFNKLEQAGFIKQKTLCYIFLMYREYQTVKYQPGVYYLETNDGIEYNIETMMDKKLSAKDTVRLTFPEGWSIAQIFEKIEKYNVCDADKLYANLDIVAKEYGFINEIDMKSGRYLKAEGYLFPDTYDFYIDESPASVLKKLFSNFENRWTGDYDARLKELGMTMDEIINIAAMIQREAKNTSQMGIISSVIHNRLNNSSTFPTLDMNSTKDYITSLKQYDLFSEFYYKLYLDTYNTYRAQGLPPGPICNPGAAAIKAALYPEQSDYYFFMHSPTGEIYLARTKDEHQLNTELYL